MSETPIAEGTDAGLAAVLDASAPHLSPKGRGELASAYLGNLTWHDACAATGLDLAVLPYTTRTELDSTGTHSLLHDRVDIGRVSCSTPYVGGHVRGDRSSVLVVPRRLNSDDARARCPTWDGRRAGRERPARSSVPRPAYGIGRPNASEVAVRPSPSSGEREGLDRCRAPSTISRLGTGAGRDAHRRGRSACPSRSCCRSSCSPSRSRVVVVVVVSGRRAAHFQGSGPRSTGRTGGAIVAAADQLGVAAAWTSASACRAS